MYLKYCPVLIAMYHKREYLFYILLCYIPCCVCNCNLERRNVVGIFVNDFILNEYRYLYIISYIHVLMYFAYTVRCVAVALALLTTFK